MGNCSTNERLPRNSAFLVENVIYVGNENVQKRPYSGPSINAINLSRPLNRPVIDTISKCTSLVVVSWLWGDSRTRKSRLSKILELCKSSGFEYAWIDYYCLDQKSSTLVKDVVECAQLYIDQN